MATTTEPPTQPSSTTTTPSSSCSPSCSISRCQQHRRTVRRQLQRWSKNVVYLVGKWYLLLTCMFVTVNFTGFLPPFPGIYSLLVLSILVILSPCFLTPHILTNSISLDSFLFRQLSLSWSIQIHSSLHCYLIITKHYCVRNNVSCCFQRERERKNKRELRKVSLSHIFGFVPPFLSLSFHPHILSLSHSLWLPS